MSEENIKNKEHWSGVDLQKIGIIGVLVFFSNFLINFIVEDRAGTTDQMRELNGKVNTVIVKQEVLQESLNMFSTVMKRDSSDLQKQIDSLNKNRENIEKQLREIDNRFLRSVE